MSNYPNKRLTRLLSATMLLSLALSMTAFAADQDNNIPEETVPPAAALETVSIKANATEVSVKEDIESHLKAEYENVTAVIWPSNTDFSEDVVVTLQHGSGDTMTETEVTIQSTAIEPNGFALDVPSMPTIRATDEHNKSASALLSYVNSERDVIATGSTEYDKAFGETPVVGQIDKLTWSDSNIEYDSYGGSYVFTASYEDDQEQTYDMERTLKVESVNQDVDVHINYKDNTVSTTSDMEWSLSRNTSSWKRCSANMKIPDTWQDEVVYFRVKDSNYASGSSIDSLYIPPKAEKPDIKPELVSTTRSITITNCWDFGNVEFSINGSSWRTTKDETYTFTGLDSDKSYTVYIRTRADQGELLASDAITSKISTKEPIHTDVIVENEVSDRIGIINALATIEPNLSSKTLSGSLTATYLTKFNNIFDTYNDRYNRVEASLTIDHFKEADEYRPITTTNFSMPMSSIRDAIMDGGLTIEYRTDAGRVYMDNRDLEYYRSKSQNGTLKVSIQEMTSVNSGSKWEWLRDEYKNGDADFYRLTAGVNSYDDTTLTWTLPVRLEDDESISSIRLYQVESNGERHELRFEYDSMLSAIRFDTDKTGYFAVLYARNSSMEFPFTDVPAGHWAWNDIAYCYNRGIFAGTSETTFSPDTAISRAMIAALLARLDNFDAAKYSGKSSFDDVAVTDWYAAYAEWAHDTGIMDGDSFNGADPMTRQEIAKAIYDYLKQSGFNTSFSSSKVQKYEDQKDIDRGNTTAVQFMRYIGVMVGNQNNCFGPDDYVTRAEMAAMMHRLSDIIREK